MAFTTIQGSGSAPDSFLGSAGVDAILLTNQERASFVSARAADDSIQFQNFTGVLSRSSIYGGQGNDTLIAPANNTVLSASFVAFNEGNDTIGTAAVTGSTIQGNQGFDTINLGGLITASLINGNQNDDVINITAGTAGGSIFGGQGIDAITVAANQNLTSGTIIQGNEDGDLITVNGGGLISGTIINGNQGNDTIAIGAITAFTTSTVFGGTGDDTIGAAAATVGVVISSDDGADSVTGSGNADTISSSSGNDNIAAGAGADVVTVTAGNVTVTSGTGTDSITTGAGIDTLRYAESGSQNQDRITGFALGTDITSITIGNIANNGVNNTLSNGNGADINAAVAAGNLATLAVATGVNGDATVAPAQFMFLSSTTTSGFAGAIGAATVTVNALGGTEGLLTSFYDAGTTSARIGYTQDTNADNAITNADTFVEITRLNNISAAQYTQANLVASLSLF